MIMAGRRTPCDLRPARCALRSAPCALHGVPAPFGKRGEPTGLDRAWTVLLFILAAAVLTTGTASANARRTAMGDVITARNGAAGSANVAFRAIPPALDQPRIIPLPIGLAQVAISPPTFNTDDPDFSAVEIANLLLDPPFDLRLTSPPSGEDARIEVRVAKDEIVFDLGEAQSLVPAGAFEHGGRFGMDLFSSDLGFVELGMSPLFIARTRIDFSDDLRGALRNAEPLTSSKVYAVDQMAEAQAAMALGVAVARQVAGPDPAFLEVAEPAYAADGWRLYAGAGFRYLLGLAYFDNSGRVDVIPAEPLLDPDDPTDVSVHSIMRTSVPGSPGTVGHGFALDLGVAALEGRTWEIGLGVTDLAGSIVWRTNVEEMTLDQTTGELVTRTLAENQRHRSKLSPQTTLNLARHWRGTTLATDVRHGIDGLSYHLGAETRLGIYALRGGALLDGAGLLQATGGGGIRMGPVGLDASLFTSSANLAEKRALLLGLALAIY